MLSAKVGHLEATVEGQGRWLKDVDTEIKNTRRELGEKLDHISSTMDSRTRMPMLPMVTLLVVAGGFLLTVMGLVYASHDRVIEGLKNEVEKLREQDRRMELRRDSFGSRLTRLETLAEVIPRGFKEQLEAVESRGKLRSQDRWSRSQDDERTAGHERAHESLEAQIKRLEQQIGTQ